MDTSLIENEPEFTNVQLFPHNLPSVSEVHFQNLDPNYKQVLWLNFIVQSAFALGLGILAWFLLLSFFPSNFLVFIPIIIWVLWRLFTLNRIFKNKKYAVREHDIIYQSGWLIRHTEVVPFKRVQHILVHESWLARLYGLASLYIYTTGGTLLIPGLKKSDALQIEVLILNKIKPENNSIDTNTQDSAQPSTDETPTVDN